MRFLAASGADVSREMVDGVFVLDRIHHAAGYAYDPASCMLCQVCREHTLPSEAFRICPLYLFHEKTLGEHGLPGALLALIVELDEDNAQRAAESWMQQVFHHWTEAWTDNERGATLLNYHVKH